MFGEISLTEVAPDNSAEQRWIIFDPVPRVDGIEASADPLFEPRANVYLMSGDGAGRPPSRYLQLIEACSISQVSEPARPGAPYDGDPLHLYLAANLTCDMASCC